MIGYLNMPYGTIITVTGRVKLVPENTGQKGGQTRYFIVTHIEDKKLHKEIIFDCTKLLLQRFYSYIAGIYGSI